MGKGRTRKTLPPYGDPMEAFALTRSSEEARDLRLASAVMRSLAVVAPPIPDRGRTMLVVSCGASGIRTPPRPLGCTRLITGAHVNHAIDKALADAAPASSVLPVPSAAQIEYPATASIDRIKP